MPRFLTLGYLGLCVHGLATIHFVDIIMGNCDTLLYLADSNVGSTLDSALDSGFEIPCYRPDDTSLYGNRHAAPHHLVDGQFNTYSRTRSRG